MNGKTHGVPRGGGEILAPLAIIGDERPLIPFVVQKQS
jgi:hypothetical protein